MATKLQIQALARYDAAECFRSLGAPEPRRLDKVTAKLCGDTSKAVGPDVIRDCVQHGWLARPSAGQLCLTDAGRKMLDRARRTADQGKG